MKKLSNIIKLLSVVLLLFTPSCSRDSSNVNDEAPQDLYKISPQELLDIAVGFVIEEDGNEKKGRLGLLHFVQEGATVNAVLDGIVPILKFL